MGISLENAGKGLSAVYWCDACAVPMASHECALCGGKGRRVGRDLTPVFAEEARLLRRMNGRAQFPSRTDFALWTHGARYYLHGREVARLHYGSSSSPELGVSPDTEGYSGQGLQTSTRFTERLIAANRGHLERLEHEAVDFIRSVVEESPHHKRVVAFSGGKDSTVVSYLVRKALGMSEVLHVFSDTTIESTNTYQFIKEFRLAHPKVPFVTALPHADFLELCRLVGPPSRIKRWCCSTHKSYPLGAMYSALAGSSSVLSFCGVRRNESNRRTNHERVYTNTKIADETMACPIIEWSDFDVWLFTIYRGLPVNKDYRRGFRRIGCLFCPFNSRWSDYLTDVYYPAKAAKWREFVESYYAEHRRGGDCAQSSIGWRSRAGGIDWIGGRGRLEVLPCEDDSASFSVYLSQPWSEAFWEYLKPFGKMSFLHDDGIVAQAMMLDTSMRLLFSARASRARNHVRFTIHASDQHRSLVQRIIRQTRKHQACVLCGVCTTTCPAGAISVNGRYQIDESGCKHCMLCVTKLPSGCVAWHSLAVTGERGQR